MLFEFLLRLHVVYQMKHFLLLFGQREIRLVEPFVWMSVVIQRLFRGSVRH